MRRFLLTLTVLCVPGWSQSSAQQPAQPPIVVKLDTPIVVKQDTPPTNPWIHLVEIVVPGIIGAGLALFGVWLTNKRNVAENAANRHHARDGIGMVRRIVVRDHLHCEDRLRLFRHIRQLRAASSAAVKGLFRFCDLCALPS